MKSILQSIKPRYCELIASGKKTIEVRKTKPKLDVPFKVYIYCTKDRLLTKSHNNGNIYLSENKYKSALEKAGNVTFSGKVIGEYVCDEIEKLRFDALEQCYFMRARHGESWLSKEFMNGTCLSYKKAYEYCKNLKCDSEHTDMFYGWHISDLKIYDKPKKLSEFQRTCNHENCGKCKRPIMEKLSCTAGLSRPPQSWCYVEETYDI